MCKKSFPRVNCPPPLSGLSRVSEMIVLGVTLTQDLSISSHVQAIISKGNRTLYALKTLKAHGLTGSHFDTMSRATLVPSILYVSPAWWGFVSNEDQCRLQSVINKE